MNFIHQINSYCKDSEVWWDSSPTLLQQWRSAMPSHGDDTSSLLNASDPAKSLIRGATTNPRLIADCLLAQATRWQGELHKLIDASPYASLQTIFWRLYKAVLADAALSLRGLWEATDGKYGWVSAQVDPRDFLDSELMYHQGLELASLGPNVMVKVPGTAAGYDAIEKLVANGISINSTFSYTVPQVRCCLRAIDAGLRRRRREPTRWRSVITYMIGRFGGQGDLTEQASARGFNLGLADIRWAEVLVFRNMLQEIAGSGVPAKLLLSSIKADVDENDGATTCWHLEKTAGTAVVYTLTPSLLKTLFDAKYSLPPKPVHWDPASIDAVPADLYEKLLSLPYFVSASRADGMSAEAFHHQGAFISTAAEACASVRRMHDFIARAFQARHWSQSRTYVSQPGNAFPTGVLGEAA